VGVPSIESRLSDTGLMRQQLLDTAPVDSPQLDSAAEYLSSLDDRCIASQVLHQHQGVPLIQPRGGFARFEEQRRLNLALAEAGADIIPLTIDSHTRHNDYETAAILLERSELEDKNLLNGYPLVNHGHLVSRRLFNGINRPISLRHGTPDARLLVETALASGITEIEGGALTYSLPYTRTYPVMQALLHWQYVDRVCALVAEPGRAVHRESFGVLTATLVPPVMVVVVELCELLLAAEQGVTSFSVSFSQTGSLVQDLALARVLREASAAYLARFGFEELSIYLVYHQWMGSFPYDYELANGLIAMSAQLGAMVGADKIITKTKEEARGIPTVDNNIEAVRLVRYVLERGGGELSGGGEQVDREAQRIRKEVDSVMSAIFDLEPTPFWASISLAFDRGYIDIPFSPHQANKNRLLTRRGRGNGVYISDPGAVPLPQDALEEEQMALVESPETGSYFQSLMRDINVMQDGFVS
jgi:methylaspartate mutase epsilon subunit